MKKLKTYIFTGFGFEILLKDVVIKSVDGVEYPDINMSKLKNDTTRALLTSKQSLTGNQLKFIRTYLQMSLDELSAKIHIPASTLRSWENKGAAFTGLSIDQEKAFRILTINQILDKEKSTFSIEVTLAKEFMSPLKVAALDILSSAEKF
jgi:DNA-binding transcriptional regulator YiaG